MWKGGFSGAHITITLINDHWLWTHSQLSTVTPWKPVSQSDLTSALKNLDDCGSCLRNSFKIRSNLLFSNTRKNIHAVSSAHLSLFSFFCSALFTSLSTQDMEPPEMFKIQQPDYQRERIKLWIVWPQSIVLKLLIPLTLETPLCVMLEKVSINNLVYWATLQLHCVAVFCYICLRRGNFPGKKRLISGLWAYYYSSSLCTLHCGLHLGIQTQCTESGKNRGSQKGTTDRFFSLECNVALTRVTLT